MIRFHLPLFLLFTLSLNLAGQQLTTADYEKATAFLRENVNNKKLFNAYVEPHWFADSTGLWFETNGPGEKRFRKISLADGAAEDLFNHGELARLLSDSLGKTVGADTLPLKAIEYQTDSKINFQAEERKFTYDPTNGTLATTPEEEPSALTPGTSPDKSRFAHVKDHNLYLTTIADSSEQQLTTDGRELLEYATYYGWGDIMEGENGKRPEHFYVNWSENGKWLQANLVDMRSANKMYLLDWSVDTLYRPRLLSYYRGSPGDTGMVYVNPVFFNVATGKSVRPSLPRGTHINNTYGEWSKHPDQFYLIWTKRGYQEMAIFRFDLAKEQLDTLLVETSVTNIDDFRYWLAEDSDRIFFLSERSGWRQLYALNLKTKAITALTRGGYYLNDIKQIDEDSQTIYFTASGKEARRNPYFQHLYRISFDGSDLRLLTPEDRHHEVSLSPDGNYFVDNFSTITTPTITVLRSTADGSIVTELATASVVGVPGWVGPEVFTALADDGKTTIYGQAWKPRNFDPAKKYPVIDASYTGPHTQLFQTRFDRTFGHQAYAEMGFVVVMVDGRGSSGRSKAFHDYSYKNLGGGLTDHVTAIRQFGRKNPWVDTTRVGIYGHSAGGYDAGRGLLAYPEFYKVGVASSADHDHRMEKAWWPEMYMGWPVDEAYEEQSNITMAPNLRGKLLITHGGIDENVNPSATFKLAEALIKADKEFDMLILPSQRHGYQGTASKYFAKRRINYFLEHLRGVTPTWDFTWE
ncbi:S9 family peptidase [Neolewinella persica]|uniref:S9 family peptidase n=1 Tax=Neolewinella persica TaxID=70998 RepID=UPI0004775B2A|nr:DPP IV N-terminal domain-containing protein [Neolewinella persica]